MAATENFPVSTPDLAYPVKDAAAVTPDDNNDLPFVTRSLWVGSTGNMQVTMRSGAVVVYNNIPSGTSLPIRVSRVHATNTTAADIVAEQ